MAVFGAATLFHLLVVSVSRRRRETGLLKVLGFVNSQVVWAVSRQATTLAVVGIIIGVLIGLIAGRATWDLFASHLGVVPLAVVPVWLIAVLAVGVMVVANVLAVGPALAATRSRPGRSSRLPDRPWPLRVNGGAAPPGHDRSAFVTGRRRSRSSL